MPANYGIKIVVRGMTEAARDTLYDVLKDRLPAGKTALCKTHIVTTSHDSDITDTEEVV